MAVRTRKRSYPIDLTSPTVVIAIAQLEGPAQRGKHRTVVGNRDTYQWRSLEEMNSRIAKACDVLDFLSRLQLKPHVVVFPEYSIPAEHALSRLRTKAEQHQQIVIVGADTFHNAKTNKILNQSPILVPGRKEPIWVTKRDLSQWEYGYIDQPTSVEVPLLTWEADGHSYWMTVYISLDFMLAPKERAKGTGVFIVPMCSTEINTFRVYADMMLREDGGNATVLCNCVGEHTGGRSSVTTVAVEGASLKPAIELPEDEEAVAVFEIDCRHLVPTKRTGVRTKQPLGKRQVFSLLTTSAGIEIIPSGSIREGETKVRGAINPALFDLLGKKIGVAFLQIDKYTETADKLKNHDFEVLAVLGQHDLIVTHLHESRYDMIYDIMQVLPVKTGLGASDQTVQESFPYFRVDEYFKVLGLQVTEADRSIFAGPDQPIPSLEELTQILRLGSDWDDEEVPEEARERFLRRRWILGTAPISSGKTHAIMTISLDHVGGDITELFADFEDRVLTEIAAKPIVTGIYRGKAQNLSIHYLLRISADTDSLFGLIDQVHKFASRARVLITTTTYVVVNKMSSVALEKAVLIPVLPADEAHYRNNQILPLLSAEDRVRAIYLTSNEQCAFIDQYRVMMETVRSLGDKAWLRGLMAKTERQVAQGLLHKDMGKLREFHDLLQHRAEILLSRFIESKITTDEFELWRKSLGISAGKNKPMLTYTEKIKLVARTIDEHGLDPDLLATVRNLTQTIQVRNAFSHSNEDNIAVETFIDAVRGYAGFISKWDKASSIGAKYTESVVD